MDKSKNLFSAPSLWQNAAENIFDKVSGVIFSFPGVFWLK